MINIQVALPSAQISALCQRYEVRRLALFGSVLRLDFNASSDVDVLVEFMPQAAVTYFDLFDMQQALAALVGREVDLLTPAALSPHFRERVLQEAVTIYERE